MNDRIKNLIKKHGLSGVNSPKKTPGHPTKKGIVLAKEGDNYKLIRFGDQNMGHNYSPEARKSFKARHAKNIAKGKMSAAYWADKAFWGGAGADKKMPPKSQEYTRGLKKYQDGGKVESYNDKKIRARKIREGMGSTENNETHRMATVSADGKHFAYPTLYPTSPGKYEEQSFEQASDRGETFEFNKFNQADRFARGSWKKGRDKRQAMFDYWKGRLGLSNKKYAEGGKVATKTNPALWEKAKAQAKERMGGKHSARAMQLAVSIYKKAGGGYKGAKGSTSLSKWTKQDWTTSSGKPSEGKRRYLPKAAWSALSSAQKAATNKAKAEGNKQGKQFVPQPKAIAKKTAQYR